MENCCIQLYTFIYLSSFVNGAIEEGREYVPFIENEIELIHERHMYTDFRYITASTSVPHEWSELPEDKKATLREAHGIQECAIQFKIRFPFYKNSKRPVCLYRDTTWVVPTNSTIEINGQSFDKQAFINEVHPVRGFVVNEMNSLVRGYLIDGNFYGIIRIFDEFYAYHLHFYIEPIDNLDIYTDRPIDEATRNEDHNAIIFEYGANGEHEQERPPEDIAKQLYEKIRNATGGPVLTEVGRLASLNDSFSEPHKNHTYLVHVHNTTGPEHESVSQQRKEDTAKEMEDTPEQIALRFHDDVAGAVVLQGGVSSSDILDTATWSSYLCTLCVWVQPLFAKKFGFKKGHIYGASEIISMLKRMDWLFRAMDFNVDSVAENFGFKIKSIYVSDKIYVNGMKNDETPNKPENEYNQGRKRRSVEEEEGTPKRVVRDARPRAKSHRKKNLSKGKRLYNELLRQIKGHHEFSDCCATIAFIYLDMTPVLSVSTLRGLCSKENLILVSGTFFGHKVGIYDIQRSLFHAFGHMLGATHDKSLRARCQDRKPAKFYNPFLMHPVQQANVGLRPNSYRLSFCSKLEVTGFLNSNNLKCLVTGENDNFCGNGMIDHGEECDCGSAWQCHLQECCGESDTIFNCRSVKLGKREACERPAQW